MDFNKLTEAPKNKTPIPNNIPHTVLQNPELQSICTPSVLTNERCFNSFLFTRVLREIFYRNFMEFRLYYATLQILLPFSVGSSTH